MNKEYLLKIAKPVIFNTEMVRAILDGRKTATRRPVKKDIAINFNIDVNGKVIAYIDQPTRESYKPCEVAKYKIDDILWVRETFCYDDIDNGGETIYYRADYSDIEAKELFADIGLNWTPSIHMPKEAARIILKVKNVGVEELRDITLDEIKKEGLVSNNQAPSFDMLDFTILWDSIYKKTSYEWFSNPYVFVYEFEVLEVQNDS